MRSKPGVFGQFVTPRSGMSGIAAPAPAFTPSDLFGADDYGDWWDFRTADGLFIADDGETDPVGENDPVGSAVGRRGVVTLKQPTTGSKPIWNGSALGAIDGSAGGRRMDATFTETSGGYSSFTVMEYTGPTGGVTFQILANENSVPHGAAVRPDSTYGIRSAIGGGTFTNLAMSTGVPQDTAFCAYVRWDGTSPTYLRGGTNMDEESASAGESDSYSSYRLICGPTAGGDTAGRTIGDIRIGRLLTTEEIALLIEYFGVGA